MSPGRAHCLRFRYPAHVMPVPPTRRPSKVGAGHTALGPEPERHCWWIQPNFDHLQTVLELDPELELTTSRVVGREPCRRRAHPTPPCTRTAPMTPSQAGSRAMIQLDSLPPPYPAIDGRTRRANRTALQCRGLL